MSGLICRALYLSLFLLLTPLAAATDVYRWIDKEGVVNYGEHPPANVTAEKVRLSGVAPSPPASTRSNSSSNGSQQIRDFLKSRDARAEQSRRQQKKARQQQNPQQKPADNSADSNNARAGRRDKKQKSSQLKTLADQLNEFNKAKPGNSAPGNSGQNRNKISQKLKQKNSGKQDSDNNES